MKLISIGCIISIASVFLTIQLIKLFENIDEESTTNINKRNKIVISILGFVVIMLGTLLIWDNQYGIIKNSIEILNISVIFLYLAFQSYFDQKTKMVYSSISILMIPVEILYITYIMLNGYSNIYGMYTLGILVIPFILFILSLFRGIGFGDVLIYLVISIYYIGSKQQPVISMLFNIIVTNIIFIIVSLLIKLIKRDKNKHQPLTIFISIVTLIFAILKI